MSHLVKWKTPRCPVSFCFFNSKGTVHEHTYDPQVTWLFFFPLKKEQKYIFFLTTRKSRFAVRQCASAAVLALVACDSAFSSAFFFLHVLVTFPFFLATCCASFWFERQTAEKTGTDCVLCLRWGYAEKVVMVWLRLTCGFHWVGSARSALRRLVAPPVHTPRVAVVPAVAVVAVEVASEAAWGGDTATGWSDLGTVKLRGDAEPTEGNRHWGLKDDFLTSAEAAASSVAACAAIPAAATVATGAAGGLTVVPSTETTGEPGQRVPR